MEQFFLDANPFIKSYLSFYTFTFCTTMWKNVLLAHSSAVPEKKAKSISLAKLSFILLHIKHSSILREPKGRIEVSVRYMCVSLSEKVICN